MNTLSAIECEDGCYFAHEVNNELNNINFEYSDKMKQLVIDVDDWVNGWGSQQNTLLDIADELVYNEREISYKTFRANCEGVDKWAVQNGYGVGKKAGIKLNKDCHVRFYKSKIQGKICYYLTWSGYDIVWA